jgi:hypothetical protein
MSFFWLLFEIFHCGVTEYPVRDPSCEGELKPNAEIVRDYFPVLHAGRSFRFFIFFSNRLQQRKSSLAQ